MLPTPQKHFSVCLQSHLIPLEQTSTIVQFLEPSQQSNCYFSLIINSLENITPSTKEWKDRPQRKKKDEVHLDEFKRHHVHKEDVKGVEEEISFHQNRQSLHILVFGQ